MSDYGVAERAQRIVNELALPEEKLQYVVTMLTAQHEESSTCSNDELLNALGGQTLTIQDQTKEIERLQEQIAALTSAKVPTIDRIRDIGQRIVDAYFNHPIADWSPLEDGIREMEEELKAIPKGATILTQHQTHVRKLLVESADYWYQASHNMPTPCTLDDRLNWLENALNHTENALIHIVEEPNGEVIKKLQERLAALKSRR